MSAPKHSADRRTRCLHEEDGEGSPWARVGSRERLGASLCKRRANERSGTTGGHQGAPVDRGADACGG